MKRGINQPALKKALQMAGFVLIALEAVALLVMMISDLKNYLRMEIGNPVHQVIFVVIALAAGGYVYLRECMKAKKEQETGPGDGKPEPVENPEPAEAPDPADNGQIVLATEENRDEILALYQAQKGREYCAWSDDYPSNETIDFDFSRDALFILKRDGSIRAAISIEEDEDVARLPFWNKELAPEGELARVAVLPEEQNKGLGRIMMQFGMDELKRRGYRGIHMLVNRHNVKAIRSYAVFGFKVVGECHMFGQDFLCYEREL